MCVCARAEDRRECCSCTLSLCYAIIDIASQNIFNDLHVQCNSVAHVHEFETSLCNVVNDSQSLIL